METACKHRNIESACKKPRVKLDSVGSDINSRVRPVHVTLSVSVRKKVLQNMANVNRLQCKWKSTTLRISLARFALSLMKKDLRILSGLLTGHADLNRHLQIMGLRDEAVCSICQEEEETSVHFIARCIATMLLRRTILGDYTLPLDQLNSIHWAIILRFAKASKRFLRP